MVNKTRQSPSTYRAPAPRKHRMEEETEPNNHACDCKTPSGLSLDEGHMGSISIFRLFAEAETPVLWPPHAKS